MPCPFCKHSAVTSTVYPVNRFNNKYFKYVRCRACKLIYLDRFPEEDDYILMYPPSYQDSRADTTILTDPYKKLPGLRYSYGYQFDLIRNQVGEGAAILDYGCGTGNFIFNALHRGFKCTGAEFNPDFVKILQSSVSGIDFYTIDELLNGNLELQVDVIRLSNVLEHLIEPSAVINKLKQYLKPGGILLIEGPVEENFCLAKAVRSFYFGVKRFLMPRRVISAPPYHIFLSDRKNQRNYFDQCGFVETHFGISEDPWPFPPSFAEAKGVVRKIMAGIAKLSIIFSKLSSKNFGNIFIYSGKLNTGER